MLRLSNNELFDETPSSDMTDGRQTNAAGENII